jgi:hypothetical protein
VAGVSYDRAALRDFRRRLDQLRLGAYFPRLAQRISVGGVKLTMDGFRNQRDPYGKPWAPLARERPRDRRARLRVLARGGKPRGQKILIDTSRMRNSTAPLATGKSGGVAIPTGYARPHQEGAQIAAHSQLRRDVLAGRARLGRMGIASFASTKRATFAHGINIPQRMMVPATDRPLPAAWREMVQRESIGVLRTWIEKGTA